MNQSTAKVDKSSLFSQRLRRWRLGHDLTQADAATLFSIGRSYFNQLESAGRTPGPSILTKMDLLEAMSSLELADKLDDKRQLKDASRKLRPQNPTPGGPRRNLQAAREGAGLSVPELARRTEHSAANLQSIEAGHAELTESLAEKIALVLPGLTVEELLSGSDTPRVMDREGIYGTVGDRPIPSIVPNREERVVPLLSWAKAGRVNDANFFDEAYDHSGVRTIVADRLAFALRIDGDSMSPAIRPGDYVIASPAARLELNEPVLVHTKAGDKLCKNYQTKEGGRIVVLTSVNPAYGPIELPVEAILWIYAVKELKRLY